MLTGLSVVLTALIEAMYLGEPPSTPTMIGGCLIFYSVVTWGSIPRQEALAQEKPDPDLVSRP